MFILIDFRCFLGLYGLISGVFGAQLRKSNGSILVSSDGHGAKHSPLPFFFIQRAPMGLEAETAHEVVKSNFGSKFQNLSNINFAIEMNR